MARDPEKARAYQKAYYIAHRDEIRAHSKSYYATNREKVRCTHAAWNAAHRKETSIYNAAYRAEHKEESAAYRVDNKEALSAYAKAHRHEKNANQSVRKARIAGTMMGITIAQKAEIDEIYRRAKEDKKIRCYLCDKLIKMGDRHVDHILPVAKDGPTLPSNLAIACSTCNQTKGAKHPNELGILV